MQKIKIGTRGSPLALWQARDVEARLRAAHAGLETEIVVIKTSGDWNPAEGEVRLSEEAGGKGLFAKEIEAALIAGHADIGVHSMKDMDSYIPAGLSIDHILAREDSRDALLLREDLRGTVQRITDLPVGAVVGTSSVRRASFLLAQRPDLKITPFRGNVQTRIEKLRRGQVDASFLALAGLKRLGLEGEADLVLEPSIMLPAAGQGAVGVERRRADEDIAALLAPLQCARTFLAVSAERAALKVLDGTCYTPIGAHAFFEGEALRLSVQIASLDGRQVFSGVDRVETGADLEKPDALKAALALGQRVGTSIKAQCPEGVFQ